MTPALFAAVAEQRSGSPTHYCRCADDRAAGRLNRR
jgi:hypothetical protein